MLILGRNNGQRVSIHTSDGVIKLIMLPDKKIGIDAPPHVNIVREEIDNDKRSPLGK